jgi:hypothetical protein
MTDLKQINDRLERIEKMLERICPPVEQIDVSAEVRRIEKRLAAKRKVAK